MDKRQLIEEIRRLNTTVTVAFLSQFDEPSLEQYLQHLQEAQQHTRRIAGWVRPPRKLNMAS